MRIYFAGAIRASRNDASLYEDLVTFLNTRGEVLTEHVGNEDLISQEKDYTDRFIHDRDMEWLLESDVVIGEVTTPSLGVGYEIGRAIELGKPILCIYRPKDCPWLSAMISGSPDIALAEYKDLEEAKKIIDDYVVQIRTTLL